MNSIFGRTVASGAHLGLYGHGTYHILVGESIRTIPYGSEYKRYSRYRRYIRIQCGKLNGESLTVEHQGLLAVLIPFAPCLHTHNAN